MKALIERTLLTHVLDNQTTLVNFLLDLGLFQREDIANAAFVDGEMRVLDIETWYLISEELAQRAALGGMPILSNDHGCWLGIERGTSLLMISEKFSSLCV